MASATDDDSAPLVPPLAPPLAPPHPGRLRPGSATARGLPAGWPGLQAKVAQYPDCQQLQLWLPPLAADGWTWLRLHDGAGRLLLLQPLAAQVSAGDRLLLDTLAWPPGDLRLSLGHRSGAELQLALHKAGDDQPATLPQPSAVADVGEDLRRRDAVQQALAQRFARRLSYGSQGRAGRISYHDGALRLDFDYELGGGDEPLRIEVPPPADWERRTGVALAQRAEILDFVAREVQRDQTRSWQPELRDDAIVFVSPRDRA